jgi:RHH-type proline utilization regulon transcriptional repressor/proline dehydrogenase/delta 1-pyrroline-5-carboxylate dehydrogenase
MLDRFSEKLYADEAVCVDQLLHELPWDGARAQRVYDKAADLVTRVRASKRKTGELESFFQQYGLDSEEGLALMTLAEALLRIPDAPTAAALIRDKMAAADWLANQGSTSDWMVKAAGVGLSLTRKTLDSAFGKLGEPVIRKAMAEAMKMMGRQFVLGETIEEAIKNAKAYEKKGYRLSYDMLGEGARTQEDAQRYFESYAHAIKVLAQTGEKSPRMPGISVKLSALYPRYYYAHANRCVPFMVEQVRALCLLAAQAGIALTIDAEEVERLEISISILEALLKDYALSDYDGLGLAVQAYSKRTPELIDHLIKMARENKRRIQVRLVKGAYWDTEIKRAQVLGLSDYPLFTRKENTDVSYLACAHKLLAARDVIYPQFATHNAFSIAGVLDMAQNNREGFELQRLHGMGESLHDLVIADGSADICVYAPVGSHQDLLPYLVRRLLENGANGNFVNQLLDPNTPLSVILKDPVNDVRLHPSKRHRHIPLPKDIYGDRKNSKGIDVTDDVIIRPFLKEMRLVDNIDFKAVPFVNGVPLYERFDHNQVGIIRYPARQSQVVGHVVNASQKDIEEAFSVTQNAYKSWRRVPVDERAAILDRMADLMEQNMASLMGLCVREAGKNVSDALGEVREAVDFCRYYAEQARLKLKPQTLKGPTGERNILSLEGRGVFVCISPWNFPLAIFIGQVAAALVAGNTVIAKPAEQTPLIAMRAIELLLEAGLPKDVVALLPGAGDVGAALIAHKDVAGVAFTGSTEVSRLINRALAAKDGPIVPLIAETGGQNAMIVDSSSLLEQVLDDVLVSAFGAAGQRCSALRVLCIQDDIADKFEHLLRGAIQEMIIGNPMHLEVDMGPVIDAQALASLQKYADDLMMKGRLIAQGKKPRETSRLEGHFMAPKAFRLDSLEELGPEQFGPILHIYRYNVNDLDDVIEKLNATGYGLTLGVHSRIQSRINHIVDAMDVGNAYVNRTMIGAVVGVQPFGGRGLSGTGPKAGGPHYLMRFSTEKVVSTDTTRQGGNATLVSLVDSD